jgi:hypothetical protein
MGATFPNWFKGTLITILHVTFRVALDKKLSWTLDW